MKIFKFTPLIKKSFMQTKIYNTKGKEAGSVNISDVVFGTPWNADLVHQVVTSLTSNARHPIAHVKTRGEVRGGGRKPWQQKGLGRARHGSSRSPIWVGGGITHGPRNDKNFSRKVNRQMKTKALYAILSRKYKDNEVLFVDELNIASPKAKEASEILKSLAGIKGYERLSYKKTNAAFIALPNKNIATEKSFRNFGNIEVGEARNLNPLQVLNYKYLVIANPEASLSHFSKDAEVREKSAPVKKEKPVKKAKTEKIIVKPEKKEKKTPAKKA
jgi:large subunit ribosomal protein L4